MTVVRAGILMPAASVSVANTSFNAPALQHQVSHSMLDPVFDIATAFATASLTMSLTLPLHLELYEQS